MILSASQTGREGATRSGIAPAEETIVGITSSQSTLSGRCLEPFDAGCCSQAARIECVHHDAGPKGVVRESIQNSGRVIGGTTGNLKDRNTTCNQYQVLATGNLFQTINHIICG